MWTSLAPGAITSSSPPPSLTTRLQPTKSKKADKPTKNAGKAKKKPVKASRRDEDDNDDDEDDDAPRKKKKKQKDEGGSNKLLIGIVAAVVLIGGVVGGILAFGGKSKDKDTAKTDPPANTQPPPTNIPPQPGTNPLPGKVPPQPVTVPPQPGTNPSPGTVPPQPGTVPPQPGTVPPQPGTVPPKKDPDGLPPGLKLPDPPVIKISGSLAPVGKLDSGGAKPPAAAPLLPDEDPFIRAKQFRLDSPLPTLPKLPPIAQRPLLTLDPGGHSAFIVKSFITPKADRVITVGEDKAVRIWDIATGEPLQTIRLPAGATDEGKLMAAALSPDGTRLAVAGKPLKVSTAGSIPIFIINLETATLVKTINASKGEQVEALDFSNDGNQLAAGCNRAGVLYANAPNGWVQLFDVKTSRFIDDVAQPSPILEIRFNPDQKKKMLATTGYDHKIRLYNFSSSSQNRTITTGTQDPTDIAWTTDGSALGVSTLSGEIGLFSLDGQLFRNIPAHSIKVTVGDTSSMRPVEIRKLLFLANGKEVACCGTAGAQGWAGTKDIDSGKPKVSITQHTNVVMALGVSGDGTRAVSSGGNQHETFAWDTASGKIVSRLCGTGNGMWGVGWAKDGKSLAYGTSNVTQPDGSRPLDFTFRFDDFGPGPAADETKYQQSLASDGTYRVSRLEKNTWGIGPINGQPRKLTVPEDDHLYSATVLPGRRMVVAAGAFSLTLVDPQDGKIIRSFRGHTGNVLSVAPSPDGKFFVTGSSDQTIRIWLPEFEDPLLSLFVGEKDWIAWTPQGFYACSGNGERLLAWQVNNGSFKFPMIYPAERFRASMYQPALIKYLIPSGSMPLALAMATKFDKALVLTNNVADVIPPEVTLLSPDVEKHETVDQATVTVKASAKGTAKQPITAMRLLVDGRPFQGSEGIKRFDNPQPTAETSWEVPVLPGPHSFAVIAESPVSKGITKAGVVTRAGDPPKPNLYVLAVGVSAYPPPNTLRYCATDALLLAKTFQSKSKGLFADIEIRTLTDAQATKKGIREGLDWLKSKMTAKDVGIVSFSGHGSRDDLTGKFYLVPVDFNGRRTRMQRVSQATNSRAGWKTCRVGSSPFSMRATRERRWATRLGPWPEPMALCATSSPRIRA